MHGDLKAACAEANLALPRHGLVHLTFGNVSVADHGAGVFAIKPSGLDYATMSAADMVVLDFEGKTVEGRLRPSSDTPTHLRLYQAWGAKAGAVVHTHSRHATAWAQAWREIPCLGTTHADYFHGPVPLTAMLTRDEVESGYETATGTAIVERFAAGRIDPVSFPGVLVPGHGPFAWGPDAAKAVENAVALEFIAEMAALALALNPNAEPLPAHLLDKHFLRKHGATAYYGQRKQ